MKLKLSSYYPSFLDSFLKLLKEIVSMYMIQNKLILYMKGYKNLSLLPIALLAMSRGRG